MGRDSNEFSVSASISLVPGTAQVAIITGRLLN